PESIVDAMRNLAGTGTPLGEKKIGDVECVGFQTTQTGHPATVWADKKTAEPVRIEMQFDLGGKKTTMVMDHFEIDPALDDALFSLDPPAEYKLTTQTMPLPKLGDLEQEIVS